MTAVAAAVRALVERPMIFTDSVPALLDDTKTQTRRIIKLREFQRSSTRGYDWTFRDRRGLWQDFTHAKLFPICPYGVVGDRLWARETWYCDDHTAGDFEAARVGYVGEAPSDAEFVKQWREALDYRVTHDCNSYEAGCPCSDEDGRSSWRSPLHMSRWASRITLEITEVRVQRLHEITEADAWAEGIGALDGALDDAAIARAAKVVGCSFEDGIASFGAAWDMINGRRRKRGMVRDESVLWSANPWVWAITFKRVEDSK